MKKTYAEGPTVIIARFNTNVLYESGNNDNFGNVNTDWFGNGGKI